ncbi:MAG: RNA-directed DNA polymerase [Chloroflexi bacterium]|nr:RNA-directed DNA polymerase [Chloroflexota bacterium]
MTRLDQILPDTLVRVLRMIATGYEHIPYRGHDDPYRSIYWMVGYRVGIDPPTIRAIMEGGDLPAVWRYRHFTVPKKDGSPRQLMEPGRDLKAAQRELLRRLNSLDPHPAALGFREGLSIADHAWTHAGARTIITADIEDFFPSTQATRIYDFWVRQRWVYDEIAARFLTRLTTYRGGLPQGAPTSPALSNLVNVGLDTKLAARARSAGATYTRYADDLVFSWPDEGRPPADFQHGVHAALHEFGYRLQPRKGWRVWHRRDEPEVTGLILTRGGSVDIPDSMKALMQTLERTATTEEDFQRLAGYEGYRQMVVRE